MSLSLGLLFGLLAMFGYGLSNAFMKIPAKKLTPVQNTFLRALFVSIIYLIIMPFFDMNLDLEFIIIAFIIAFIGFLPIVSFYKALSKGKVGIIAPVANSAVIFTVILSFIFFNETLGALQISAIIIIIAGILLISLKFSDLKRSDLFRLSSGLPFALITCAGWGLLFFFMKFPVNVLGPILTAFIIEFGAMVFAGFSLVGTGFKFPSRKTLGYIFLVAIGGAAGTLFYTYGISVAPVSIVATLTFANPIVAVTYGRIVYKEKLTIQQLVAISLILIGVVLISI